jgi:hypothetical protein
MDISTKFSIGDLVYPNTGDYEDELCRVENISIVVVPINEENNVNCYYELSRVYKDGSTGYISSKFFESDLTLSKKAPVIKKKIYFGGRFRFMYKDYTKEKLAEDYRAKLLGDVDLMLRTPKNRSKSVYMGRQMGYIGPFYFYDEGTSAEDIVNNEYDMVERCDEAVFLLDDEPCPGTISELIHASVLYKNVRIYYVKTEIDKGEPENEIYSKQWYAIMMAIKINEECTDIIECADYDEAVDMIVSEYGVKQHNV